MTARTQTPDARGIPSEPLDPQAAQILQEVAALPLPVAVSLEEVLAAARLAFRGMVELFRGASTSPLSTDITDHVITNEVITNDVVAGGTPVRVRVYEPEDGTPTSDVLLYVHGGGWVVGTPDDLDHEMCTFAHRLGTRVVSVDYRLAPEHPYPAAFDDCMTVVRQLNKDPAVGRIAVAGDSAGGNIAAAIAIACRDEGIPLSAQLLIYPALDPAQNYPSHEALGVGFGLTKADMASYWSSYLPDRSMWTNPTAAPDATPSLRGLAPAVVVTAGYDPLRDEGNAYARRLIDAAVPTTHLENPSLPHAFLIMTGRVPVADKAVHRALDALAEHLLT